MDQAIWIIDGNNFVHRDRHLAGILKRSGMESASKVLASELAAFRRRQGRGHSVALVFDGVSDERSKNFKGFRILRPGPGEDADLIVLDEARRHEGRTQVHVVTSDRADITSRLRGLRIICHSVEEFAPMLRPNRRRRSAPAEAEEESDKPGPPRGDEVKRWLEYFGEGPPPADDAMR